MDETAPLPTQSTRFEFFGGVFADRGEFRSDDGWQLPVFHGSDTVRSRVTGFEGRRVIVRGALHPRRGDPRYVVAQEVYVQGELL